MRESRTAEDDLTAFQCAVVRIVAQLRPGEILTYKEVAMEAGHPGASQAVANVLRRVGGLPWWRVVPSSGRLYRTHVAEQAPRLAAEGVLVDADRRVFMPAPDAYLAATAVERGALLCSADRDFARFDELRWRHPLDDPLEVDTARPEHDPTDGTA